MQSLLITCTAAPLHLDAIQGDVTREETSQTEGFRQLASRLARVGSGEMELAHSWNVKMAARLEIEIAFIGGSREFE